ncbi:hypothetical protein R2R32_05215 [Clostridium perfringens]|nr:hypothetical protein [Clostridium perfringens]
MWQRIRGKQIKHRLRMLDSKDKEATNKDEGEKKEDNSKNDSEH